MFFVQYNREKCCPSCSTTACQCSNCSGSNNNNNKYRSTSSHSNSADHSAVQMYGTGSDHHYRDSSADHIVQRRTARRVMFTDECSCDLWEEEIRRRRYSSSHVADCWSDHAHNSNNAASSCDCENAGRLEDPSSGHHYQTPKEVDGDYSYAYR